MNTLPPPDPAPESKWVNYPPLAKRTNRQRFIFRAAERYGLTNRARLLIGNHVERVEKSFHDAMMTCPLPADADNWDFQPTVEDFFTHLAVKRLEGAELPLPLERFAPES